MAERLGARSVVVTFEPHPRIAMRRDEGLQLLTSVEERAYLLQRAGIEMMVVAHFDDRFREQPFEHFVEKMLVEKLGMRGMIVGYNHRLGRNSEGNYESLQPLAQRLGFELERVEQYTDDGDKVSSTVVRRLLSEHNAQRAMQLLGHPYIIIGSAEYGRLRVEDRYKLLPDSGRYSAVIDGTRGEIEVVGRDILFDTNVEGRVVVEL